MQPTCKMLIVDDEERDRSRYATIFKNPSDAFRRAFGEVEFDIHPALSINGAKRELSRAKRESQLYDVVLLDMWLPEEDDSSAKDERGGLKVLEAIAPEEGTAVVAISAYFDDLDLVRGAFQSGAMDFVPKSAASEQQIWSPVMSAWEKAWLMGRYHESELQLERLTRALEQATEELADRFAELLRAGMREMLEGVDQLAGVIRDRYMLREDRDSDDPMIQHIAVLRDVIRLTGKKALDARAMVGAREADYGPVDVWRLLVEEVGDRLRPAQVFRRVKLNVEPAEGSFVVETFRPDLRAVLEETLFGAMRGGEGEHKPGDWLKPRPWRDVKVDFEVEAEGDERMLRIRIADQGDPIPEDVRLSVNAGQSVDLRHRRWWGLWAARRIAHNGIGKLEVQLGAHNGNMIVLSLPMGVS